MKYIKSIGVEIEGGWDTYPEWKLVTDGSVSCPGPWGQEVNSPVFFDEETLFVGMRENYPQYTNSSCGLHVHVAFGQNALLYSRCMDEGLYDTIMERLRKWGEKKVNKNSPFWDRLNGNNRYCADKFHPDEQARQFGKESCRYAALNFCWRLHGTLEIRVLPTFKNCKLAISAIRVLIDCIETHLRKWKREKKETWVSLKIEKDEENKNEFYTEKFCIE